MPYTFSLQSQLHLDTCHPILQKLADLVLVHRDIAVIEGYRDPVRQEEAFRLGLSHIRAGGKHNVKPSKAIHFAPYHADRKPPIDWNNREEWLLFDGFVLGIAAANEIKIRCGGDWDRDGNPRNQTLHDCAHFELID